MNKWFEVYGSSEETGTQKNTIILCVYGCNGEWHAEKLMKIYKLDGECVDADDIACMLSGICNGTCGTGDWKGFFMYREELEI